ncbi:MAG: hypothetical protein B7Z77_05850, partial [Acidocella sp. 20-58-15]
MSVAAGFTRELGGQRCLGQQNFGFRMARLGGGKLAGRLNALDGVRDIFKIGGGDHRVGCGGPAIQQRFFGGAGFTGQ